MPSCNFEFYIKLISNDALNTKITNLSGLCESNTQEIESYKVLYLAQTLSIIKIVMTNAFYPF